LISLKTETRSTHGVSRRAHVAMLLLLASFLLVPARAETSGWKIYGSTTEGFRALFPSSPQASKSTIPLSGESFELRSYVSQIGSTALYVGVCDFGPGFASAPPEELLANAQKGAIEHADAHLVSEKKVELDNAPGVSFEAESDKLHFSARIYLAAGDLYQIMVATPVHESFPETDEFLDSLEIPGKNPTSNTASAPPPAEWKSYSYPADNKSAHFTVDFPAQPIAARQTIATDIGRFELRTFVSEDSSTSLIASVCDYGAPATGKDPASLLAKAREAAIVNLKAHQVSERKVTVEGQPGLAFEAQGESTSITARLYLAGSVLYQTMVVAPTGSRYPGQARFLDSFALNASK
jgi:hypothetical protein